MITIRADKGSELSHAEMDTNFIELRDVPAGKIFPKEQNIGIKIDIDSPDFGWHDLHGMIHIPEGEPNIPNHVVYIGNIQEYQFDESDMMMVRFHLPHDYVIGSNLYIHVHWSTNSTVVTGGSCTWAFETTESKGHNQGAFAPSKTVSIVAPASTIQYRHLISETTLSVPSGSSTQLDTDNMEPDTLIVCRFYLDSNDITTSNASTVKPFIHMIDLHYQSNGLPTKNKEPNFWG